MKSFSTNLNSKRITNEPNAHETIMAAIRILGSTSSQFEIIKKKLEEKYETEILPESESVEEKIVNKETAVEIHKLLHKLKDPYKEVFWMRTFGELSFAEIAEIHGKTESWARVTYYRAKEQIDISDLR